MKKYGLIGHPLGHSFSQKWFEEKFARLGITDAEYRLYDIDADTLADLKGWVRRNGLSGFNVTAPYKVAVMDQLYSIEPNAADIEAVNCVDVCDGLLVGYNTDVIAFRETLKPMLPFLAEQALVLGTGGSARAVCCALEDLGIRPQTVSRQPELHPGSISYEEALEEVGRYQVLVNCTPLGTAQNAATRGKTPWPWADRLKPGQLCYDLVYNPSQSRWLREAAAAGATTINGLSMLHFQAELSWGIWTKESEYYF